MIRRTYAELAGRACLRLFFGRRTPAEVSVYQETISDTILREKSNCATIVPIFSKGEQDGIDFDLSFRHSLVDHRGRRDCHR